MKNININQSIRIISSIANYAVIIATATLLAKIFWWLFNPLGYDSLNTLNSSLIKPELLAQSIINRAPFGVVVAEKQQEHIPTIIEQVKVVGVYAAGPRNSVAFLQVNSKNIIAQIGEAVLGSKLTAITPQGVILTEGNQNVTINISSNSSNSPNNPAQISNNGSQYSQSGNSYIPSAQNNNSTPSSNTRNLSNLNDSNSEDSIAEKRRKMIEAFQHQQNGNNADNANSNSNSNNYNNGK